GAGASVDRRAARQAPALVLYMSLGGYEAPFDRLRARNSGSGRNSATGIGINRILSLLHPEPVEGCDETVE
ncbi:MAG: hypothetical protein ACE5H9_19430, partial [Anaerolineae bacterium]